ncbi:cytochrome c biogenesis protein ResB [Streptomyces sp.]|uniref:cytochrome c biogenesis protein ResB n=1 Tax=Streptomyces sp. TaxID=1931 RepID=UPI002F3E4C59
MSTTHKSDRDQRAGGAEEVRPAQERPTQERSADDGLGAAGAQLSTQPADTLSSVPGLGLLGWLRWMWRQLTSMRVALILLFLLSLAAIPGSLIPQHTDDLKVETFKQQHPDVSPLYDRLGLFHVYSSPWFAAIYILLFISLAGCIIPRSWQFVGQLRARPPAAPQNLTRLPAYTTWRTDATPEQVAEAARTALRGRRFRTSVTGTSVAAEKGYLREFGNLVFHVALFGLLIAFAVTSLYKAEGGKLIVEGDGFSNNLTQYDDFSPGTLYGADDLQPFGFDLNSFSAKYATSGPERGSARMFRANIHYWNGADGTPVKGSIAVNHPLSIGGEKVYLISHGYAPVVTVRDGQGNVAYEGPVPFLPQDNFLTSVGVIKVPDAIGKDGKPDQLGFQGTFAPTFAIDNVRGPHSTFPTLDRPALFLTAYHGDLGLGSGLPQNVYQLETRKLKQYKSPDGQPVRDVLVPGATMKLPGGGSLTFDGVKTWASFTISHQSGSGAALISGVAAILGLAGSLFIQRRRVWVRAVRGTGGVTLVEMGGLGRSESARIADELGDIALQLQPDAPAKPEEPAEPDAPAEPEEPAEPDATRPTAPDHPQTPAEPTPLPDEEGARA